MRVTLTTLHGDIFNLDVSADMELVNFKALCEAECGVPAAEMSLLYNGRPLHDDKLLLKDYGIVEGDMLLAQRIQGIRGRNPANTSQAMPSFGAPAIDFSQIQVPNSRPTSANPVRRNATDDPLAVRQMLLNSPSDVALLRERNPPLAEALLSGDQERFVQEFRRQHQVRSQRERERVALSTADPFDPDIQRKIAEEIRLRNVESNMEAAIEYSPESFGQVSMLYIDCEVNGHPVKAFVDSGAQMTIMSQACAERCGIMRLVDTRWAGVAKGVGTQRILGRVHLCTIKIKTAFLQTSFSILEDQPMDMLLGLDMLKRHQCVLDLRNNKLIIGTSNTETPFLPESELPEHARLNRTPSSASTVDEDRQLAEALSRSAAESAATIAAGSKPGTSRAPDTNNALNRNDPFSEADVRKVTDNGYSRQQAIQELRTAKGNVDLALATLIAKSFQF